jgi:tetratricopeptide (TPR) repeat protein
MLEAQARIESCSIPLRLQLAREYAALGRDADAIRALEEALGVTVFDRTVHVALLPLYRKTKATKKAVRAARCVVDLRSEEDTDEQAALAWLDLAEVLHEDGQADEAKGALGEAKRLVPKEDLERLKEVEGKLGQ